MRQGICTPTHRRLQNKGTLIVDREGLCGTGQADTNQGQAEEASHGAGPAPQCRGRRGVQRKPAGWQKRPSDQSTAQQEPGWQGCEPESSWAQPETSCTSQAPQHPGHIVQQPREARTAQATRATTTPPLPAPTMASAAVEEAPPAEEIDPRFEYDAPRFYDFELGSPHDAPAADGWFDTEGPKGQLSRQHVMHG